MSTSSALLEIEHLTVDLKVGHETRRVIHDTSFSVAPGEAVGLVGESGSGKSMTARSIMRLLPLGAKVGGRLAFCGQSIMDLEPGALREFRRQDVGIIYQDPRAHINPLRTVGDFLVEALIDSGRLSRRDAVGRAVGALQDVGIPDATRRLRQYPHELSGGLLQRVMIASVLIAEPKLMLADEPTTALDVTTQQEVIAILDEQRRERDLAVIFITHDLDLATAITDRIAVMYAGTIVEIAPSHDLHAKAMHPYTRALLESRPRIDRVQRLQTIPGRPSSAFEVGAGCVFVDRCPYADERARSERPTMQRIYGHDVACHRAGTLEFSELERAEARA